MSIFPTRILVATDGSEEAALALTTAAGTCPRAPTPSCMSPTCSRRLYKDPFRTPYWRGRPTKWSTSLRTPCTRPNPSSIGRWSRSRTRG
jgi:hypothetical protein